MTMLSVRFLLAFVAALLLTILPLPAVIAGFRPPWILLFVLYLQFFMPHYFRVAWLFFLGLCLDMLLASVIGEHAFALLLTAFIASAKTRRFHFYSMAQQMGLVMLFCLIYQSVIVFIDAFLGYNNGLLYAVGSTLMSLLFWPWIKLLADNTLLPRGWHS